jgi:hypothetical protein
MGPQQHFVVEQERLMHERYDAAHAAPTAQALPHVSDDDYGVCIATFRDGVGAAVMQRERYSPLNVWINDV